MRDAKGSFTPLNRLELLLLAAANDPTRRAEFHRALLSETILVLGRPLEDADQQAHETADTRVHLYGIDTKWGRVIPAFTSEYRLREFIRTPQQYIGLMGRDLVNMLEAAIGLVLNPGSACGKEFYPEEIAGLRILAATSPDILLDRGDTKS